MRRSLSLSPQLSMTKRSGEAYHPPPPATYSPSVNFFNKKNSQFVAAVAA